MKKPRSQVIFDRSDRAISAIRLGILAGTGVEVEEAAQKPLIAIANSHTEFNPGHMHLRGLAQRVREGVLAAGGLAFEFNVPAPCDGLAEGHHGMRYVLPQRELIADAVETYVRSMRFDGLVLVASCDKIIPGMLMAAARLDLPTVLLPGGPSEKAIRQRRNQVESVRLSDYQDPEDRLACVTSGSCGACEVMGTANTFQCLGEALGLALPGSATVPAYAADKLRLARACGRRVVGLVEEGLGARRYLTAEALENALLLCQALGGSTNAALHLPALAHELGLEMPLERFNQASLRVPTLCAISPNGPHGVLDLHRAGGVPAVMRRIADQLNLEALTVAGPTWAEVTAEAQVRDPAVIPPLERPHFAQGGTVALFGNLAPEGAVIKQSAANPELHHFSGPARVFESEEDCLAGLRQGVIVEGEVVVIRNEGPKGGPGMPETLAVTVGLNQSGLQRVALVTDGRFSGASQGPCVGHVSPEAAMGGPIAALRDGDRITIDIAERRLEVQLSPEEMGRRLAAWKPRSQEIPPGYMRRYVKLVSSAAQGAVLD
ncbi:dihydroxy-acid dehydratase [Desulfoferula mesophila]|uniref:Dihydroxy-acid dehydratase n=1 Tax=Desulfoferula mesophila TaxID=3058419 RepID=A0AAU9EKV5_9BACT|nr:dihydroxy-acid dehydratase [Desulfoferula mesophilus]